MENRNHKNKNIERKYLKVKNSLLELEKRSYRTELYINER